MRQLKQILLAVVLTFTLSICAVAGTIETPPAPPPPPPSESTTATGTIDTPPSTQTTDDASDGMVDLTLSVLQSVLSLF